MEQEKFKRIQHGLPEEAVLKNMPVVVEPHPFHRSDDIPLVEGQQHGKQHREKNE